MLTSNVPWSWTSIPSISIYLCPGICTAVVLSMHTIWAVSMESWVFVIRPNVNQKNIKFNEAQRYWLHKKILFAISKFICENENCLDLMKKMMMMIHHNKDTSWEKINLSQKDTQLLLQNPVGSQLCSLFISHLPIMGQLFKAGLALTLG